MHAGWCRAVAKCLEGAQRVHKGCVEECLAAAWFMEGTWRGIGWVLGAQRVHGEDRVCRGVQNGC